MTKEEELKEQENKELKTVVEAVTPVTIEAIKEWMKKEMPNRKNIFADGSASERQELNEQKKQAADYFKALGRHDKVAMKALSSGASTDGSEFVPTYVSDQLITVAQKYGLIRQYGVHWPMPGINVNIPTAGTVNAYRLGADGNSIQSSQPVTGAVQLRAKTVGAIVPISDVLLQNATVDLVDAITFLIGKAIAKLEDQWGFLGLGAGEGVFQTTGVPVATLSSGNITYNSLTATNLLDVEDLLDENFIAQGDNLRWILSRSVLNTLRRQRSTIKNDDGVDQPQGFLLPGYAGQTPPTLWDHPYDTSAVMPKNADNSQAGKKFLALVDYDNLIYGESKEYFISMSDQATILDTDNQTTLNMFQQNMTAIKIWGLCDIQLANPTKAFGVLATSAS